MIEVFKMSFKVCPKRSIALFLQFLSSCSFFLFFFLYLGAFFVGQLLLSIISSRAWFDLFASDSSGIFLLAYFRFMLGNQQGQSVSHRSFINFEFRMIKATQVYSYLVPYIFPFLASLRILVGFHN